MSFLNVRVSFHKLVDSVRDPNIPLLSEPDQPWMTPCYRIEWYSAEIPRGPNRFARGLRILLRDRATLDLEARAQRLIQAIGLGNNLKLTIQTEFDFLATPMSPKPIGTYTIERANRGIEILPPPLEDPTIRHLAIHLNILYDRRS
jgi:hypothetical protein